MMPAVATVQERPVAPACPEYTTPDSDVTYRTAIRPPDGLNLSLRDFHGEDAAERHPELARVLADFLDDNGVQRAFAPTLRFTRTVAEPRQLDTKIMLPNGIPVYRNEDLACDAVMLTEPGDAMLGSFGGCAAIAAVHGELMAAGHGGRDNLIHRELVLNKADRDSGSIVHSMARHLKARSGEARQLRRGSCRAFYSVPRKSFRFDYDHPEQGEYNRALESLLRVWYQAHDTGIIEKTAGGFLLDQGQLIAAQARRHFRTVSTCLDPLKKTCFAHTRHAWDTMRDLRNLVVIVRTA